MINETRLHIQEHSIFLNETNNEVEKGSKLFIVIPVVSGNTRNVRLLLSMNKFLTDDVYSIKLVNVPKDIYTIDKVKTVKNVLKDDSTVEIYSMQMKISDHANIKSMLDEVMNKSEYVENITLTKALKNISLGLNIGSSMSSVINFIKSMNPFKKNLKDDKVDTDVGENSIGYMLRTEYKGILSTYDPSTVFSSGA